MWVRTLTPVTEVWAAIRTGKAEAEHQVVKTDGVGAGGRYW